MCISWLVLPNLHGKEMQHTSTLFKSLLYSTQFFSFEEAEDFRKNHKFYVLRREKYDSFVGLFFKLKKKTL